MASSDQTWSAAVEEATEQMKPFRCRVLKRRLRNPKFRDKFIAEVQAMAYECDDCPAGLKMQLDQAAQVGTVGGATHALDIRIGERDWQWVIDKIIEWAPTIIKILMMLFAQKAGRITPAIALLVISTLGQ